MNTIIPEMNIYPDERIEALFTDLIEQFDDTGNPRLDGPLDALLVVEEGNGTWGVLVSPEGEMGIWFLADEGTITLYINGNTEMVDVATEEDYLQQEGESLYDWFWRILEASLPVDVCPEKIPLDVAAIEGEELANKDIADENEVGEEDE